MDTSVIIPAFNEEKNIGNVLSTITSMDNFTDIVVVSDGSSDNTIQVSKSFGVKTIELPQNMGKSYAMWVGVQNTSSSVILFLDADLKGIKQEQILDMLQPVCSGSADMSLGIFNAGRGATDLAQKLTPFLTGQRAVRRSVINGLNDEDWTTGFGIEIALTRYARDNDLKVVEVQLDNVTHAMKEEKLGLAKGVAARLKMYWEIAKEFNKL